MVFFLLSLLSLGALAATPPLPPAECADEIISASSVVRHEHHLYLQRGRKKYVMGLLAETADGKWLLALGGYRNRHSILHQVLSSMVELELVAPYKYLWGGEMLLRSAKGKKKPAQIIEANETWGLWTELQSDPTFFDEPPSVAQLKKAITENAPELLGDKSRFTPFSRSQTQGRLHLMRGLDSFITQYTALKGERPDPDRSNWRHNMGNKVMRVLTSVDHILKDDTSYPKKRDKIAAIEAIFAEPLVIEALSFFVRSIANDNTVSRATYLPMLEWVKEQREFMQALDEAEKPKEKIAMWKEFAERATIFFEGEDPDDEKARSLSQVIRGPRLAPSLPLYQDVVVYELKRDEAPAVLMPPPEEVEYLAFH